MKQHPGTRVIDNDGRSRKVPGRAGSAERIGMFSAESKDPASFLLLSFITGAVILEQFYRVGKFTNLNQGWMARRPAADALHNAPPVF